MLTGFLSMEKSLGVLFEFCSLNRQFDEVVIPANVGGLVHEKQHEISLNVDQFVSTKLELD